MHTGVGEIDKLGEVRKLNNQPNIKIWRNNVNGELSVCNMVNGTDSTIFPPRIPTSSLYIYSTDICRYGHTNDTDVDVDGHKHEREKKF